MSTLFNLCNGGGKTVLVQLMMQPVNPKAKAGGRSIEEYFVRQGDHSFVLLEWELDGSRDKLLIGIAIAAGANNSPDETRRGNHVKYYTFQTVYEGNSQYSISELELSKNENGRYVPASFDYVREKAKASRGVLKYYSSDESTQWSQMLSEEYGIHKMEWESVIETLNQEEGGLNQYFSEAGTSDKLIAKFFIPAIEHKLMSAASRKVDSSLETMIINYAKKINDKENVISQRDTNSKLLDELAEINDMAGKLLAADSELSAVIAEMFGFKAALSKRISVIESEVDNIGFEIEKENELIEHVNYEENSKAFYIAEERSEKAKSAFEEITKLLEKCKEEIRKKKHLADVLNCAKLYEEIQIAAAKIEELKRSIEDKEKNSEDNERIASLKYSVFVKAKEIEKIQSEKVSELLAQVDNEKNSLQELEAVRKKTVASLEAATKEHNEAESDLKAAKNNTDKRIGSLHIKLGRKLDDFYSTEDLEAEKTKRVKRLEQLNVDKSETEAAVKKTEKRKNEIPGEKADIQIKRNEVSGKLERADSELEKYDSFYDGLARLCEEHNLDDSAVFSGLLRDYVRKDIDSKEAERTIERNKKHEFEEKKAAVEKGCLHILPEIMRYVESTGIFCLTGEEYLSRLLDDESLSHDKAEKILSDYPEFAYSLLFNTPEELRRLLSAGNIDWLPAAVPLFTMEQVERIFDGSMEKSAFLSAYDITYFSDRESCVRRMNEAIANADARIAYLTGHLDQAKKDQKLVESFNYPEGWRDEQKNLISSLEQELADFADRILELDKESETLSSKLTELKEKLELITNETNRINAWLESFAELEGMISEELELYEKQQSSFSELQKAKDDHKKACEAYENSEVSLHSLENQLKAANESLSKTREILTEVSNAKEARIIDGELNVLYSQYQSKHNSRNESLDVLKKAHKSEQEKLRDFEEALGKYKHKCGETEYKTTVYSSEQLYKTKEECERLEKDGESYQSAYNTKSREDASATEGLEKARESLADHDGVPLPKEKIGDNFKERIKTVKTEINSLNDKRDNLNDERRSLEKMTDQVSNLLEDFKVESVDRTVVLDNDPFEQRKFLGTKLKERRKDRDKKQKELTDKLKDIVSDYEKSALAEITEKLNSVREMVESSELKEGRLFNVRESIDAMMASIEKINSKIETDLREIENDFKDIVEQCFIQGKRMYTDLRMIAASSRAHIYEGRSQVQMVKMDLPDENTISEEASRISIKNEIEQGVNDLRKMFRDGSEDRQILKRAKAIIESKRLLHKYICQDSISVKVYKIDLNSANSSYKKWEDSFIQSSGAEKFVVFFSVVLTLINYTRSSAGLINRNMKSVLILDNPFGKITSAHLLKPMFDIAKHFNVQLICLSDINKSDVISCFECVIKLVIKNQSLSNYEIMTHEGNELIEHGYYKINRSLSFVIPNL